MFLAIWWDTHIQTCWYHIYIHRPSSSCFISACSRSFHSLTAGCWNPSGVRQPVHQWACVCVCGLPCWATPPPLCDSNKHNLCLSFDSQSESVCTPAITHTLEGDYCCCWLSIQTCSVVFTPVYSVTIWAVSTIWICWFQYFKMSRFGICTLIGCSVLPNQCGTDETKQMIRGTYHVSAGN